MTTIKLELTQEECDYIGTLLLQDYMVHLRISNISLAEKIRLQASPQWRTTDE